MGLERRAGEIAIGHSLRRGVGHRVSHRRPEEVGGIKNLCQEGAESCVGSHGGGGGGENGDGGEERQLNSKAISSTLGCVTLGMSFIYSKAQFPTCKVR